MKNPQTRTDIQIYSDVNGTGIEARNIYGANAQFTFIMLLTSAQIGSTGAKITLRAGVGDAQNKGLMESDIGQTWLNIAYLG